MNTAQAHAAEIILNINPFGETLFYPAQCLIPGQKPITHRYITSIWKTSAGAWRISGTAGTRTYIFYSKREAMKAYNQEARRSK